MVLRHSFSKKNFGLDSSLSDFLSLQKSSYDNFLQSRDGSSASIYNVLRSLFPISDSYGFATLDFLDFRLSNKSISVKECKLKSLNYESDLFVKFRLVLFSINEATGEREIKSIKDQEVFLCSIPLLTDYNTIIINGIERIVTSQIHKSPSVVFSKKLKTNNSLMRSVCFIPYYGSRVEFLLESKNNITCRIDKKKKINIYDFLTAFGIDYKDIISYVYEPIEFKVFGDFLSFSFDFSKLNSGSILLFDLLNKKGEIIAKKESSINKSLIRKLSDHSEFFCKKDVILNQYLFNNAEAINSENIDNLLQKQSFSIVNFFDIFFNPVLLNQIELNKNINKESLFISVAKAIYPGDYFSFEDANRIINKIFFDKANYNLFDVGRYKLNSEFKRNSTSCFLEKEDILIGLKKMIFDNDSLFFQDIDSLSNRRIRNVGELLENQLRAGLSQMIKQCLEKMDVAIFDTASPSTFVSSNPMIKAVRDFTLSDLSQFADQTNIVSQLSHIRKISALGKGGIAKDRATSEVRDVHTTYYGRICPVETPDGKHVGLINNYAISAKLDSYGFILTPYRKIINNKISNEIVYLDAKQESMYYIGHIGNLNLDGCMPKGIIPCRFNGDFLLVDSEKIQYVDTSTCQVVSVVSNLIPFLECNDTGRALMGCNMQKQAVPLLYSNAPVVGTGIEKSIATQSGFVHLARKDGQVVYVDSKVIYIDSKESNDLSSSLEIYNLDKFERSNKGTLVNQKPLLSAGQFVKKGQIITDASGISDGEVSLGKNILVAFMPWNGYNYEDSIVVSKKLINDDTFTSIHIEEFEVSIRDTRLGPERITRDIEGFSEETIASLDEFGIIQLGANVKSGDVLVGKVTPRAETPITSEEKLLRAIFGDKMAEVRDSSLVVPSGFFGTVVNVEILTKRGLVKDSRSLVIERMKIKELMSEKERKIFFSESIFHSKLDEIIKKENIIFQKDWSINKKLSLDFSSKFKAEILNLKITYETLIEKINQDYIKNVSSLMDGEELPNGALKIVKVYVAMKSRIQPGDKMAGRHGNKGVISTIVPVEDMPFMEDGTPVDIILNAIGVIGRMNLGQIFETHLGLASYGIGRKISEMIKNNSNAKDIKDYLLDLSSDINFKSEIKSMSDESFLNLCTKYSKEGFAFSTPVFDGANVEEIGDLLEKSGFHRSGKMKLYDGRTGRPFDKEITVGLQYILKLHHLVDGKMHARSTGPYSLVTQQPLGGKAQFGGQRFGEMEVWALEAYGASYTLQEMLTVKSDDVQGRIETAKAIKNSGSGFSSCSGTPESFNVLLKELKSMGFAVNLGVDKK